MLAAGQRTNRVRFERSVTSPDDGFGNEQQGWVSLTLRWAGFRPKLGREQLAAGRPESTMSGVLTVLRDSATDAVTPADRVEFIAGPYVGRVCQILSITPTQDGREIEMALEYGAAV